MLALKNRTVRIPDEFRGVTLNIWQKTLLRLGKPIFVTLEPGVICIVFIEGGILKYKCSYSSINAARKSWRLRVKKRRGASPVPVSQNSGISSAAKGVNIPAEDDGDGDGDQGDGNDGYPPRGDSKRRGSAGPALTPYPSKKKKPPKPEKKDKKKDEPGPAAEPWFPPSEPECEPDSIDLDESPNKGPEYEPDNTPETPPARPKGPK